MLTLSMFFVSQFNVCAGKNQRPIRVVIPSNAKVKLSSLPGIVRRFRLGKTEKIRKEAKADLADNFGKDGVNVFVDWILSFPQYNWSSMEKDLKAVKGSKVEDLKGREKLKRLVEDRIEFEEPVSPQNSSSRSTSRTFVPNDLSVISPDAFKSEKAKKETVVRRDIEAFVALFENFLLSSPVDSLHEDRFVTRAVASIIRDGVSALVSNVVSGQQMAIDLDDGIDKLKGSCCLKFKASGDFSPGKSILVQFEPKFVDDNFAQKEWNTTFPIYHGPEDEKHFFHCVDSLLLEQKRLLEAIA